MKSAHNFLKFLSNLTVRQTYKNNPTEVKALYTTFGGVIHVNRRLTYGSR